MRSFRPVLAVALLVSAALWFLRSPDVEARPEEPAAHRRTAPPAAEAPLLSGRVERELRGARVGVARALVVVACDGREVRALTARDGSFSFKRAALQRSGPSTGAVRHCEVRASAVGLVSGTPGGEVVARVELGEPAEVRLRLFTTAPVTGRVLRRGAGVEGARLSLLVQETPASAVPFGVEVDVFTDAEGNFTIPWVGPGTVRVLADHDPFGTAESAELVLEEGMAGEPIEVDLTAMGAVVGVVRDTTGATLANAEVRVIDLESDELRTVTTDASGAFRVDAVPAGSLHICASEWRHEPAECVEVELAADVEHAVEAVLVPRSGVAGRVVGPSGEPVGGATVMVVGQGDAASPEALQADASGRFFLPDRVGNFEVFAYHSDFLPSSPSTLTAPLDHEVVLRLRAGGRVAGRVLDGGNVPPKRVTLFVTTLRGDHSVGMREVSLAADGTFELGGFDSGLYRMSVSNPDSPNSRPVEVRRFAVTVGRLTQLGTLRFEPEGTLTGVVLGDGSPLAGAQVRVAGGVSTLTDDNGRFTLDGVASGATLYVEAMGYKRRLFSRMSLSRGQTRDLGRIPLKALDGQGSAEYSGIGSQVSPGPDGGVMLTNVFPGSPAERAGITPGSVVIAVDGLDITDLSVERAIEHMLGPAGSSVTLMVIPAEGGPARPVRVVRADVVAP